MLGAGLTAEIVIAKIKSSKCDFDTSPDALKGLKAASVPDGVILAMVEVPRTPKGESIQEAVLRTAKITCLAAKDISILSAPGVLPPMAQVNCGERVSVLEEKDPWDKIRTSNGTVGYVAKYFVGNETDERSRTSSQETQFDSGHPRTPRASAPSGSSQNTLSAVAWRAVPWVTTSYWQQPGSATTDCTGSGSWFGNIWQGNASCTSQYTPAQSIPINWTRYTIYNLVETSDSWMVLGCTRNWAFSKCSYLIPGNTFPYEDKKGKISIKGHRSGKDKEQSLDLDIISTSPKTNR
jgi:hypothetical protein